jgi:hypothetical protein
MASKLVRVAAGAALLYAARRFYRNWGTTKEECGMALPGDGLVSPPAVQTTEGVWIDASPGNVWPWLVQMGQDRGGLYTYPKLQNMIGLDYENADRIHPEWQCLAPGDVLWLAPKGWMGLPNGITFTVVDVVEQESIVLRGTTPRLLRDAVWSFHLIPRRDDRCRLLIRTRTRLRHPGEVLATELAGPANAAMTQGILRGVKRRVECQLQAEAAAASASRDLHRVV